MLFIAMTMLGYISYQRLPFELLPNAELPQLVVNIYSQVDADAKYMEQKGIVPIEGAIGTLENVESIESLAESRRGEITIKYEKGIDPKIALLKLQERVDQVQDELPDEFFVQITEVSTDFINQFFMGLEVIGTGGINRVRKIADEEIVTKIENLDGVSNVDIFGGRQKSVIITLNSELCKAHNISLAQVLGQIRQQSAEKTFVGNVYNKEQRIFVNVDASFTQLTDLQNIPMGTGNLKLNDIADIFFGFQEENTLSRVNGKETVYISIQRDPLSNMIDLSGKILDEIDALNRTLAPQQVETLVQYNMAEIMERNLDQVIRLSIIGGLLAIAVLWVFLRKIRLISVIALAIPISVFSAFNLFYAFDISVNTLTMVGMILAIGMLLDNSIVVLENIYRLTSQGLSPKEAVLKGTKEVLRPVIASTLTTITVFMPFIYSPNLMVKIMGGNVGISIVTTLTVSLLTALLLVPMLTHSILQRFHKNEGIAYFSDISIRNLLIHRYVVMLKACMRKPAPTIIGTLALFFIVFTFALLNSRNTMEEAELKDINVYVTMPAGSTLDQTDKVVAEIEEKLMAIEEKEKISSRINQEDAILTIRLAEDYEKKYEKEYFEIKDDIKRRTSNISNVSIEFEPPATSGGRGGGSDNDGMMRFLGIGTEEEKVIVKGSDFELMQSLAFSIKDQLETLSSVSSVRLNVREDQPELHLNLDQGLIARYDIPLQNILAGLNTFNNQVSSGIYLKKDEEEFEIILKSDADTARRKEKTLLELKELPVNSSTGDIHELESLSDMVYSKGINRINRVNQEKQIELTYSFNKDITDSKGLLELSRNDIDQLVAAMNIPSGIAVEVVHEENQYKDFKVLIIAALVLIYMILASIFGSFYAPLVIMLTIPLAAIGSILAITLTGNSIFNPNVLMGFIILLGIVVNNGIILIDYTNLLRRNGYSEYRAIITAGISRVRPIFITAITTIIAMLPLAMGQSEYVGDIGAPFAITVIGGLAFSTLLTLVFIPTFYTGMRNALQWIYLQNWKTQLTMAVVVLVCALVVHNRVDRLIFIVIWYVVTLVTVPSLTYLVLNSLRKAKEDIIGPEEPIILKIENLVKEYDREKRFVREWKYSQRFSAINTKWKGKIKPRDLEHLIWQLPVLGYLFYFTYFYVDHNFWNLVLAVVLFFYIMYILRPFESMLENIGQRKQKIGHLRAYQWFVTILYWAYPLPNLYWLKKEWDNLALAIIAGVLWYAALAINRISSKIHRENTNLQRLTGRFRGLRYFIYNTAIQIPLIGKKQKPFKALRSVSLEIGTGMFGLLGPNGAGKSTLMKVICGVIEQSYGKIKINGHDTQVKREELQGLIGYLPQEFGMYENMTAYNYLDYMSILKNIKDPDARKERVGYVLKEVNMWDNANDKIGSFSGGMKQRIGIAQILLHLPRILVVDEPTAGIDPRERIRFRNLLIELSRKRVIIFSTHIIEDISSSCNRVAVLNQGKVKYLGNPTDMTQIAEGHVWQFFVEAKEFEQMYNQFMVVNHMRDGGQIRVRVISENRPVEGAEPIAPSLEDAYLWLQTGGG
jgi:multidrug efflux pump subunit AcrB/ABC-type multidrug transport system ATPase subunit